VPGPLHVEERRRVIAVREHERRRLVDRGGSRPGLRIGPRPACSDSVSKCVVLGFVIGRTARRAFVW
jgi:hypothetical protein